MNWTALQNAIHAWFAGATGLTTVWANQNVPRQAYPFAVLNVIAESQVGGDEMRYTLNVGTGKLDPTVAGMRQFTVSCQVHQKYAAPVSHATSPRNYLALARASLRKQTVLDTFKAAGLAVVRALDSQTLDRELEGAWVGVGVMDIQFAAAENVADTSDNYIETVQATGTMDPSALPITGPFGVGG